MKTPSRFFQHLVANTFIFLMLTGLPAISQSHSNEMKPGSRMDQKWLVRLMGGSSVFLGDIKQNPLLPASSPYNEWRIGGGLNLEYRISPVFSITGKAHYAQLAGMKAKSDHYFEADLIEGSLNLQVYPVNIFSVSNGRIAEFYIFGGIGLSNYDARLYRLSNDQVLASSGYGNGKGIAGKTFDPVVAAGIGIDFPIGSRWMITLESSNKAVASDMLDVFASGFDYDVYNFTAIGLAYKFGNVLVSKRKSEKIQEKNWQDMAPAYVIPAAESPVTEQKEIEQAAINQVITIDTPETKVVQDSASLAQTIAPPAEEKPAQLLTSGYRVQLLASSKPYDIAKLSAKTGIAAGEIAESTFNKLYIYVTGLYADRQSAIAAVKNIRAEHATPDAFIVYFDNGRRTAKFPDQK